MKNKVLKYRKQVMILLLVQIIFMQTSVWGYAEEPLQAMLCSQEMEQQKEEFEFDEVAFHEFVEDVTMMISDEALVCTEEADEFQTKRLVVKATEAIKDESAILESQFDEIYVFQYETIEKAKEAYGRFLKMKQVLFVEPDEVVASVGYNKVEHEAESEEQVSIQEMGIETDLADGALSWGISAMGLDVFQSQLSKQALSEEIIVAVVDTGLNEEANEVFDNRVVSGVSFINPNPRYVKDKRMERYEDDNGHGTAVAGIIAEATPSNVKIMPIKSLDYEGLGTELMVYTGIMYAIREGADVINLSCGVEGQAESYEEAMAVAKKKQIPVVVAAGNENQDVKYLSPACIDSVFTVASVNEKLVVSKFSNYGVTVDFAAPGEDVELVSFAGGFVNESGTSFAAPHISGAIALLLCIEPDLEVVDLSYVLRRCAVDLGEVDQDIYYGYGFVDFSELTEASLKIMLIPTGDADEDGSVTLKDVQRILRGALGIDTLTESEFRNADVDESETVTLWDVQYVLRTALGIE